MPMRRREMLRFVPLAAAPLFPGLNRALGESGEASGQASANPEHSEVSGGSAPAAGTSMEKVTGIGGLFFRAQDPKKLAIWYRDNLGVGLTPTSMQDTPWQTEAGMTFFTPFPTTTKYFGDPSKMWMVNFRVKNLDRMVAQLRAAGITVDVDPQPYANSRFAHLHDPEGNPIELWQPA